MYISMYEVIMNTKIREFPKNEIEYYIEWDAHVIF